MPSPAACCRECEREPQCSRWTFSHKKNRCHLKHRNGWKKERNKKNFTSGRVVRTSAGSSSESNVPCPVSTSKFSDKNYAEVLELSWLFYEAQRSGPLPSDYRVKWRRPSHLNDTVVGGWYDAGDYLKLNFPLASTVTLLAWGMLEFDSGYKYAEQYQHAKDNLKVASDYLLNCRIGYQKYIGQIGHPDIDHDYWGRASEQKTKRPAYIYDRSKPAADLMGKVAAALAASSLVWKNEDPGYSRLLLSRAEELWQLGHDRPGLYSNHYTDATASIYKSSGYEDDMSYGAAWIYRAGGNESYLKSAVDYWRQKYWSVSVDWDNSAAAAGVLLANFLQDGIKVPHGVSIDNWVKNTFINSWVKSNGRESVVKTPKGLSYLKWSKWGNLRHANNAAFLALAYSKHIEQSSYRQEIQNWARSQVDYALGSSGRSFVVGYGQNPPERVHHAGASCPDRPAACGWAEFSSSKPNPQILYGALVGGPAGPGDDTYRDKRDDYVTNEVTSDYNAGFTSALAGLIDMLHSS